MGDEDIVESLENVENISADLLSKNLPSDNSDIFDLESTENIIEANIDNNLEQNEEQNESIQDEEIYLSAYYEDDIDEEHDHHYEEIFDFLNADNYDDIIIDVDITIYDIINQYNRWTFVDIKKYIYHPVVL